MASKTVPAALVAADGAGGAAKRQITPRLYSVCPRQPSWGEDWTDSRARVAPPPNHKIQRWALLLSPLAVLPPWHPPTRCVRSPAGHRPGSWSNPPEHIAETLLHATNATLQTISASSKLETAEALVHCEHRQHNPAQEHVNITTVTTENEAERSPPPQYPASEASSSSRPPPFSSLFAPLHDSVGESSGKLPGSASTEACASGSVAAPAYSSSPPPDSSPFQPDGSSSRAFYDPVGETKRALPPDTKGESSRKDDDAEPPPAYSEGDSPLQAFTYVMSAAGGAASIITQVQQGGPTINAIGGK
ncbi:hypothetical protein QQS21_000940 [Conoideocrella luteorostrata]|uniref:Uncharacterized protein n=1 Tax=Conoideocrella luteorostrata TaxID=1105319 RepID=A0AAJ0CXY1_9HYPO|nr:hypothetical protein QQS21_000940 [Conoideocrella luteorostrata]